MAGTLFDEAAPDGLGTPVVAVGALVVVGAEVVPVLVSELVTDGTLVKLTPAEEQRPWEKVMAAARSVGLVHDFVMQVVAAVTKASFLHKHALSVGAQVP